MKESMMGDQVIVLAPQYKIFVNLRIILTTNSQENKIGRHKIFPQFLMSRENGEYADFNFTTIIIQIGSFLLRLEVNSYRLISLSSLI